MASNLLSRFLPPGTGEPSIYETLRQQDDSDHLDVEERAGMGAEEGLEDDFGNNALDSAVDEELDAQSGSPEAVERPNIGSRATKDNSQGRPHNRQPPKNRDGDELEDEVPQSLLIEGRGEPLPGIQAQRQARPVPPHPAPQSPEIRTRWQSTQQQQRLHLDPLPPQIRPRNMAHNVRANAATNARERALWMWANISNLDIFLKDVYEYYLGNGIWCITLSRMLNLL